MEKHHDARDEDPVAARDGFVTYDELRGPNLDAARWGLARPPLPGAASTSRWTPTRSRPSARASGATTPRFSLSHDRFQSVDSPKYLIFSTLASSSCRRIGPRRSPSTSRVENIGGEPADYRQGMAAFHVFDLDVTQRVFAVCGTSTRILALHEQLPGGGGEGEPFYHVIESPYEDFDDDFSRLRRARSRSTGADRPRPRASTAARCTRPTAP